MSPSTRPGLGRLRTTVALAVLIAPVLSRAQEAGGREWEARSLFDQGVSMAAAERWAEAESYFARADELVPRASSAYNRALALYRLGRLREMKVEFDHFLERSDPVAEAADRAEAVRLQAEADARLGRINIEIEPSSAIVRLDHELLATGSRLVTVDPGPHELSATAPGFVDATTSFSIGAGERRGISLKLPRDVAEHLAPAAARPGPAPSVGDSNRAVEERGSNPWPYVVIGLGGASLAAALVTGVVANRLDDSIGAHCQGGRCPLDLSDDQDRMLGLARASDALLVGGVVLVAGGATWGLLSRPAPRTPRAALGPRGLSFSGSF